MTSKRSQVGIASAPILRDLATFPSDGELIRASRKRRPPRHDLEHPAVPTTNDNRHKSGDILGLSEDRRGTGLDIDVSETAVTSS